jgi:acyl-CoA synthetase (AMP-forming)/AMP-acid ligase II/NAD(P)-dependent dehydrogenase (short-subunit alcohol dehydrogenase family)/aryl carrier-like protein
LNKKTLESLLLQHESVRDCVVLERPARDKGVCAVAYVVPNGALIPERLDDHIRASDGALEPPDTYVPVAAIPLDDFGGIDHGALDVLPVIDDALRERFQAHLAQLAGVEDAAVYADEASPRGAALHLATVIPGWSRRSEAILKTPVTEDEPAASLPENVGELAVSYGAPLDFGADTPQTLGQVLLRAATRNADTEICYLQAEGFSSTDNYATLSERAQRIGAGLRKAGVEPGGPVLMQLSDNADFISVFWGCVAVGAVPVPIAVPVSYQDDAGAVDKLVSAWSLLDHGLLVANRTGVAQLEEIARQRRLKGFRSVAIEDLAASEGGYWHPAKPEDIALMMLTSGTTGAPKAVTLSHRNLIGRSLATQIVNELTSQDVSLNWMPLDHVAGLVYFHLRDVFLGCRQLHAPTAIVLQEPTRWLDWMERYRVTVTFAPNFGYALLNDLADEIGKRRWDLSSVRYLMNAGEMIVAATARRFLEILEPHGLSPSAMLPAWGMSETSSAVTFARTFTRDSTSDEEPFVEVGAPIPGFHMRIVDDQGRVVRGPTEGNLEVRGVSVTPGYYKNPKANTDSFTSDGWLRTGDLAFLRDGRLTVTGRSKDVIIVNGINYYSHEIEKVVDDLDGVTPAFSAACAVRDHGAETDQLAILFHTDISDNWSLARLLLEIRQAVVQRIGISPRYLLPVAKEAIPRTGIGKIQRPLLRKQIEAGELDGAIRRVECLLGGSDTVPAWFHCPVWVRRETLPRHGAGGACLLLFDGGTFGEAVRSELERRGHSVVAVHGGPRFERLGEADFRIDPEDSSQLQHVLEEAALAGVSIQSVVNLWPYETADTDLSSVSSGSAEQWRGTHAFLHLIRTLDAVREEGASLRILAVTNRLYSVDDDEVPHCTHAALPGLMLTASQEMSWLGTITLDLSGGQPSADASHAVDELESNGVDSVVAYRRGHRWVRRLERLSEEKLGTTPSPFQSRGVYLLTGGLGGIGRQLARYLLTEFNARLLLVGRRPLPSSLQDSSGEAEDQERVKALRDLGELPGEVEFRAVDICDEDALRGAVAAVEDSWGAPLAGVVHLAGSFRERLLMDESVDSFTDAGRAKVRGTEVLCNLVRERPGAAFVAFSSVNGFFGGYGAGAYAAANSFLEGTVQNLIHKHGVDAYCLAWSLWDDVGMSRGYALKEAAPRRGFHIIQPSQGLGSLLAALSSGRRHLLIGLDDGNANIRPFVVPSHPERQRLVAYVAPRQAAPACEDIAFPDRFGTRASCEIRAVGEIPRKPHGEVDTARLLGEAGPGGPEAVAPSTDLERLIAAVWKDLLRLNYVEVNKNFLDLGADSITMARAQVEIAKAVDVDVALTNLYEFPTIRLLASHMAHSDTGESRAPEVEESERRGAERRERMKRRRQRFGNDRHRERGV